MGTSLAMIDATYWHLAPGADEQERALLDAYDVGAVSDPDECGRNALMKRWEYLVWYLDTSSEAKSLEADANQIGEQGWELVAVTPHTSAIAGRDFGPNLVAFFKKPKT
jgi:hypothetical protein